MNKTVDINTILKYNYLKLYFEYKKEREMIIITIEELIKIELQIKFDKEVQIIRLNQKLKMLKRNKNLILVIEANQINDKRRLKKLMKRVLRLQKQCFKKNIALGYTIQNEFIDILILKEKSIELNQQNFDDLNIILNMFSIKSKKERLEYIYDNTCDYLDNEWKTHNYCKFEKDVCIGKREEGNKKQRTMGCCYHVNIFSRKGHKLCEYLKNGSCTTKCLGCKLFACNVINVKFRIKDIIYADVFFNIIQKIIIKVMVLKRREEVLSIMQLVNIK